MLFLRSTNQGRAIHLLNSTLLSSANRFKNINCSWLCSPLRDHAFRLFWQSEASTFWPHVFMTAQAFVCQKFWSSTGFVADRWLRCCVKCLDQRHGCLIMQELGWHLVIHFVRTSPQCLLTKAILSQLLGHELIDLFSWCLRTVFVWILISQVTPCVFSSPWILILSITCSWEASNLSHPLPDNSPTRQCVAHGLVHWNSKTLVFSSLFFYFSASSISSFL